MSSSFCLYSNTIISQIHCFIHSVTLILSFVLFPKEGNWKYAVGAILVLGGLTVASLEKQRNKRNKARFAQTESTQNGKHLSLDTKISLPALPLDTNQNESENHLSNGNGEDSRASERQPLMLDVEMGRSKSGAGSGPERRR